MICYYIFFFFQAEDGIRDFHVTGVQTCALPICRGRRRRSPRRRPRCHRLATCRRQPASQACQRSPQRPRFPSRSPDRAGPHPPAHRPARRAPPPRRQARRRANGPGGGAWIPSLGVAGNLLCSRRHSKERRRATEPPSLPTKDPHPRETVAGMDTAVVIVLVLLVLLPAVLVIGLFVWAAIKDGQEDKALQARFGIRRRTRLGR